jgi:iron complex outermembrane recepter protein
MIVVSLLAALSGGALSRSPHVHPVSAGDSIRAVAAPDSVPVAGRLSDSGPAPAAPDRVVTLPEVRVQGARAARGAREKLPTGFTSDLSMGMTGHALETIAEVLSQAPGVRVLQYGGLGAFSTVSLRGAPAGQVSVFLDGVPLTSAAHGVVNLSDLPVTAVERVEVYRDLSPLPLGAATPGGAIQLVTLAARERLEARVARGSFDTWDGRMSAGFTRGPARGALHFGYQGSNGDFRYHDDNGTPFNLGDDEISTRVNNRLDAGSALATVSVAGRVATVTARQALFRKAQGVPGLGAIPAYNASLDYLRSLTQLEVARAPRGMAPGARLSGSLARERTQSRDLLGRLGLGRHDTDDRFASDLVNAALEWSRLPGALSLEGSGSLRVERAELHDAADGHADPPGSERSTRGASLGLQLRPLRERVVLHAARRWEHIEDRLRSVSSLGRLQRTDVVRETQSPQLGARVGIAAGLELKANWSRAERPPDFMELFGNQGSVLGNPALRPERGESWDAGARWARTTAGGWSGTVEGSHFESDTRDIILYKKYSQSSVQALNVSRGVIRGEELSLGAGTPWGFAASAAVTLQQARDRGPVRAYYGKRLPQRPEQQLTGRIEYRRRRLGAGADLDYLGDDYLDPYNTQRVPSRTIVGAWFSLAVLGEGMRFTVEGKNLGDRGVSDVGGFPLPGRSFFVSCETRLSQH